MKPTLATDCIGVIGDSISSGFGSTDGWMFNFMPAVKGQSYAPAAGVNAFRQPVGYMAQRYPSFSIDASPGRTVGNISGIMASTLAPFIALRTNVYVVQLGTNDATAQVAAATFNAQVTTVVNAIVAAPFFKSLIWIGPGFAGEKYPDGSNAFDTVLDGIRDKDLALPGLIAGPNSLYISWRTCRINAENTTTNPGNVASGIYTSDGTHPTSSPTSGNVTSGDALLSSFTVPLMSFA